MGAGRHHRWSAKGVVHKDTDFNITGGQLQVWYTKIQTSTSQVVSYRCGTQRYRLQHHRWSAKDMLNKGIESNITGGKVKMWYTKIQSPGVKINCR